ncbi:hypothetical protein ACTMU2_13540 [Cupriavidus basilensis]
MSGLDPSVVNEDDPMQTDPALDPFSKANGFDVEAGKGRYEPAFIERYRAAQTERVARIDARARKMLMAKQEARQRVKAGNATDADRRVAAHAPIFEVWRTDADLRSWDVALDPSDRKTGSLWGKDPIVSNWGSVGFGRVVTPESWLSTWSGLSVEARRWTRRSAHCTSPRCCSNIRATNARSPPTSARSTTRSRPNTSATCACVGITTAWR